MPLLLSSRCSPLPLLLSRPTLLLQLRCPARLLCFDSPPPLLLGGGSSCSGLALPLSLCCLPLLLTRLSLPPALLLLSPKLALPAEAGAGR